MTEENKTQAQIQTTSENKDNYMARDEVQQLIDRAKQEALHQGKQEGLTQGRSEEKDKLYSELQKRDETIKNLKTDLGGFKDTMSKFQEVFNPEGNGKDAPELQPEYLLGQVQNQTNMIQELNTKLQESERITTDLLAKVHNNDVKDLRARKIAHAKSNGRQLIEEMVIGRTTEEIDASIALAETTYKKYNADTEAEKKKLEASLTEQRNMTEATLASNNLDVGSSRQAPSPGLAESDKVKNYVNLILDNKLDPRKMPDSEWAKYGYQIRAEIQRVTREEAGVVNTPVTETRRGYKRFE